MYYFFYFFLSLYPCSSFVFLSLDILFRYLTFNLTNTKFICIFIRFYSLCFSSLICALADLGFFSWTEKFRDQDACKTALDDESLRQCRKKKMTAHQRTVELVSLCVWESVCVCVRVCKCQTRQCDPRAWFLPTTTEWQLLKWLFFSCCGLSALEGRKQSLIRPECCHKVCMGPNARCFRTHTQCRYYLLKKLGSKSDLYFQFSQKQKSHGWNLWSNEAPIPNTSDNGRVFSGKSTLVVNAATSASIVVTTTLPLASQITDWDIVHPYIIPRWPSFSVPAQTLADSHHRSSGH